MKRNENLQPLSFEHHIALSAAVFYRRLDPRDTPTQRRYARQLLDLRRVSLEPHFRLEEEQLLSLLPQGHAGADRVREEHRRMRDQLDGIAANIEDPDLPTLLAAFVDLLDDHVRFEERTLFPQLESSLSEPALRAAGAALWAALPEQVVTPGGSGRPVRLRRPRR